MTTLPSPYQEYIHQSKYARWREDLKRRETWEETVDRYIDQVSRQTDKLGSGLTAGEMEELRAAILNLEILPSMRALMTAGKALERDNVAGYNCAYVAINRQHVFDEILYILCCGTGVGYSVERQFIKQLPEIPDELHPTETVIKVRDSKIGWASAYRELVSLLYAGKVPSWDTSKVRPEGTPLKTFGGRASGPGPLEELFRYTVTVFRHAAGRKLTSEECHGIVCKIGDIVVVGGVRRSALLCLFNSSDERMLNAKTGQWYDDPMREHYALANNSIAYTEKPDMERFLDKWQTLVKSKSGEPGIYNRQAAKAKCDAIGRDSDFDFGVNPCGEIILRDRQFCNLTEVVIRSDDTPTNIARKVRLATILGTIQSSFTDFRYLSKQWKKNCDEEALLGVSLDGVQDCDLTSFRADPEELKVLLAMLNTICENTNIEWADRLGVNRSKARTCSKPSGNSSQLVNCGSGMHPRYSRWIIRRTRGNKSDPVSQVVQISGVHTEDEVRHADTTWVHSWALASPENAVTRDDMTALDQLEHWLIYAEYWTDHNPSITVYVRDHEWLEVGAFVYKHFDKACGITFLPYSDHIYKQAPYEEVSEEKYLEYVAENPTEMKWELLGELESMDLTDGAKELACTSGVCSV